MSGSWPRLLPLGDRGLLVEFPPEVSPESTALVLSAGASLSALPGVAEVVPALRSVLVVYDPLAVSFDDLAGRAEECARGARPARLDQGKLVEVPVKYGGAEGPDLEAVAASCGMPASEVVRLHSEPTYLVHMLGFAPGYPYLGPLPAPLRVPRRSTPRSRVPAGSVAIADQFAGIYPQETAGGWHLIGRTWLRLFDPWRSPQFLLEAGDRVRFAAVPAPSHDREALPTETPSQHPASPRRPVLEVLEPGLVTTVQDLGRTGWRRFGVPLSGALDQGALRAANAAVGNPPGAAVLEVTFPGPRLRVLDEVVVAVSGADLDARLNSTPLDPVTPARARRGDVLSFEAPHRGQWAYVALEGGVEVPVVFGSRSTFARGGLGGHMGRALRAGDLLGRGEGGRGPGREPRARAPAVRSGPVRVITGPQADRLTVEAVAAFLSQPFEVTARRDRSGVRLSGRRLGHRGSVEILSDGLLPGSVQVPADGAPILILADGPTTGGYASIACVIAADLDIVAQATPGTRLRFEAVSVRAAHDAWRSTMASWAGMTQEGREVTGCS